MTMPDNDGPGSGEPDKPIVHEPPHGKIKGQNTTQYTVDSVDPREVT
jgi:hypothetical protein